MKRYAAITGPTPEFVRWSIEYSCDLREEDDRQSPAKCETRLRPVREASIAIAENRVLDGVCVWEKDLDPMQARGFVADEIFDFYGGHDVVRGACCNCIANSAVPEKSLYAGCYGWLCLKDTGLSRADVDAAVGDSQLDADYESNFPNTTSAWYGIWMAGKLQNRRLSLVHSLFSHLMKKAKTDDDGLFHFCEATRTCVENRLTLHVDLVPAGYSDGETWTIDCFCSVCGAPRRSGSSRCEVCNHCGGAHPARRKKVLGARPYVLLQLLLGGPGTLEFLDRYSKRQSDNLK